MRVKLQALATIVFVVGILIGMACKMWFPQHWFDGYLVILTVFWLMEMVMSFILERYESKMGEATLEGKKFMKTYMTAKTVKLLVTLALIAGYLAYKKDDPNGHQLEFAGSAVAFYLINLGIETYVVTQRKR
ncbi:MAG: hypothetical protein IJ635_06250 [Bacteroidaceae bacterium]|nr:hypothetical protein [Bacteroidaceae bacterium]